ncbi:MULTISPECIES: alpha/beta fold hydrolase [unclassified Rhodococcus (in: high G+C Gram-positive bacteria)]|uniref:alpha/beta fold hydrolase n=1 Tax=unclassified Rhodococcus (in: high G+C Gram-positive bacteria) TaxID=192944 RepID=UPI0020CBD541|nr:MULTISPECIES: alpha/beta hydrolase [unclassified Rhodococcus (in: high G+C Gram-positive bacteria)]
MNVAIECDAGHGPRAVQNKLEGNPEAGSRRHGIAPDPSIGDDASGRFADRHDITGVIAAIARDADRRRRALSGAVGGVADGDDADQISALDVTYWDILRATLTRSDPKEFLFFNRNATGKRAGKDFVERLKERTTDRDKDISVSAFRTQLSAIKKYGRSRPSDLSKITQPTLIANGDNDRMVPSVLSEDMHRRIAGSELVIYPDSGHGGIFQFHEQFAPRVVEFLNH